jgi:hypothetical protein
MSRAEKRLARRSLLTFLQATIILLFAGLSLAAYNAHDDVLNAAHAQKRAVAHVIENWPEPKLRAHAPRHAASEEASRTRLKQRAWDSDSDSTIAKRVLVPILPSRRSGAFFMARTPVSAHAAHRPRPYDPQGPPLQVV